MNHKILSLVLLTVIICGCATFTSPAREHKLSEGEAYWFDYSASRRGTILIPRHEKKNIAICAEPSPDVALEIVDKFKADVKVEKVEFGAETDIQEKVIQLAKRTQTIMFLRESLYRLCELSLNFQLEPEKVKDLYEKVIDAASDMAKAEILNAQESKTAAQARLFKTMKDTPGFIDKYLKSIEKENK